MWHAKFCFEHHDCWITPKTKKFNISSKGTLLSSYTEKGENFHIGVEFLQGAKKDIAAFVASLANDPRVVSTYLEGNALYVTIKGEEFISNAFNPKLFFLGPVISKEGKEYWELGAWDKQDLEEFYQKVQKITDTTLCYMKQGVPKVSFIESSAQLSQKQQEAIHFAKSQGYYDSPRKRSIQELAQLKKVARSTFQHHLREAESKIIKRHLHVS